MACISIYDYSSAMPCLSLDDEVSLGDAAASNIVIM
jgi:hypothetical protein